MADTELEHDDIMFTNDQKLKLIDIVNQGCTVMQQVEDLNSGLNEAIKAIAEELNIKSSVLKKAVRVAAKAEFGQAQRDHELLENILVTVGKTL